MTESWREREHNFIFWFKRIVRCLLSKLKITRLFSSTIFQNCIQVCIATPSSLVLFVSYFLSLPMEICFWLLLPIQVYVFQTVSHFAILIQLCIFMSFTTMSCPYFHNCQVFFFFLIISPSFWAFTTSPNYICGINFCICCSPFQITHANAKLNVAFSYILLHLQINSYLEVTEL